MRWVPIHMDEQELRNALKLGRGLVRYRTQADEPVRAAEAHLVAGLLLAESAAPLLDVSYADNACVLAYEATYLHNMGVPYEKIAPFW